MSHTSELNWKEISLSQWKVHSGNCKKFPWAIRFIFTADIPEGNATWELSKNVFYDQNEISTRQRYTRALGKAVKEWQKLMRAALGGGPLPYLHPYKGKLQLEGD